MVSLTRIKLPVTESYKNNRSCRFFIIFSPLSLGVNRKSARKFPIGTLLPQCLQKKKSEAYSSWPFLLTWASLTGNGEKWVAQVSHVSVEHQAKESKYIPFRVLTFSFRPKSNFATARQGIMPRCITQHFGKKIFITWCKRRTNATVPETWFVLVALLRSPENLQRLR